MEALTTDSEPWDLVVVGAGPAGSAAALGALTAAPGSRVLLLDRSDFPRDKCCGDGIAPQVLDVLRDVGAGDVVRGWPPLETLELSRAGRRVEGRLARPVWVVPRAVLDARLVQRAVEAGAVLRRHRVRRVEVRDGHVVVDGALGAAVLVGADGAGSVVAGSLGRPRGPRAVALRGYAPTTAAGRGRQLIRWGGAREPSYAWAFDRGDGLSNVGYGELLDPRAGGATPTRATMLEQLDRLLPGAATGGRDWRGHHLPLSQRRWEHADGPLLLAGDAAGLVNPLTGEGIHYAVATGVLAGRAAAAAVGAGTPASAGASYRSAVRRLLARHLRHTWAASRLSRHPAVVDAGIRAAGRDRRVFDDLVEIGLGTGRITPRLATGLAAGLATGLATGPATGPASPPVPHAPHR